MGDLYARFRECGERIEMNERINQIENRLKALEDYLNIEYKIRESYEKKKQFGIYDYDKKNKLTNNTSQGGAKCD